VTNRARRRLLQAGFTVVLLGALYLWRSGAGSLASPDSGPAAPASPTAPAPGRTPSGGVEQSAAPGAVAEAFRAHRSQVDVEAAGRVMRLLPDDREGSRHERFIVRVEGGVTVLVAHNIDLAPRVPVAVGDSVELRGEYEWNDQGGVIHWTHRDPDGRRAAGWIRVGGRTYQ